ncbi:hypothetical protein JCM8547_007339 [Rhodosporidiobolus lusitaniae]
MSPTTVSAPSSSPLLPQLHHASPSATGSRSAFDALAMPKQDSSKSSQASPSRRKGYVAVEKPQRDSPPQLPPHLASAEQDFAIVAQLFLDRLELAQLVLLISRGGPCSPLVRLEAFSPSSPPTSLSSSSSLSTPVAIETTSSSSSSLCRRSGAAVSSALFGIDKVPTVVRAQGSEAVERFLLDIILAQNDKIADLEATVRFFRAQHEAANVLLKRMKHGGVPL